MDNLTYKMRRFWIMSREVCEHNILVSSPCEECENNDLRGRINIGSFVLTPVSDQTIYIGDGTGEGGDFSMEKFNGLLKNNKHYSPDFWVSAMTLLC